MVEVSKKKLLNSEHSQASSLRLCYSRLTINQFRRLNMKAAFLILSLSLASSFAHATPCQNLSVIEKAAESAYTKKETPHAGAINFMGTTKAGDKDKWQVDVSVNEECLSTAIIYTKAGTCKVLNAISLGLGEGACG
jgi:hypothetical protein